MAPKQGDFNPKWPLVPTTLVRRTTLVTEAEDRLPVYTLTFNIPEGEAYGGILTHRMDLGDYLWIVRPDGRSRSYSMSERREKDFDITFKPYPDGFLSGYLNTLNVGDTIKCVGRISRVTYNPGNYLGLVAFGIGITECFPIAEAELAKGKVDHVRLLWASRTMADTFWKEQIDSLSKKYLERFSIQYLLSREQREGCLEGRINPSVLADVFQPKQPDDARFHTAGTGEMIRMADDMLTKAGYPMAKHALFPATSAAKALGFRNSNMRNDPFLPLV